MGCGKSKVKKAESEKQPVGSSQGELTCLCLIDNRKINICPVHALNNTETFTDDYMEQDLMNERKLFERRKMARNQTSNSTSDGSNNGSKQGKPPLSPYTHVLQKGTKRHFRQNRMKELRKVEELDTFTSSSSLSKSRYQEHGHPVTLPPPQLSSSTNITLQLHKSSSSNSIKSFKSTSSRISNTTSDLKYKKQRIHQQLSSPTARGDSKIKLHKISSTSSFKSNSSRSSHSSLTRSSHPNTPGSGKMFEIGVYSKSSGKLKRIIS